MVLASHSLESRILFFSSALFPLYITMVSTLVSVFRLCMTFSCQGKLIRFVRPHLVQEILFLPPKT